MRKGMRLLTLATMIAFLLGGCGTPLYEITDEEENLIVQGAAYMLSKHNIYQKDGMNGTLPKEPESTQHTEPDTEGVQDSQEQEQNHPSAGGQSGTDMQTTAGGEISLAESIGYKDRLDVTYDGFSLMDIYQEESYFSLSAGEGNTFVVLKFLLENPDSENLSVNNYGLGYSFYLSFQGAERIPEKQSIIADSLASYEGMIPAGGSANAVLIFEISKEQAEQISVPQLTMEHENTVYSVSL